MHTARVTKRLDKAIALAKELPADVQDELAGTWLRMMGEDDGEIYQLTSEEMADLDESLAEIERGELATDEEVRAMWAKYGL